MTASKQMQMKDPKWFMIRESLIQIIESDPDGSETFIQVTVGKCLDENGIVVSSIEQAYLEDEDEKG